MNSRRRETPRRRPVALPGLRWRYLLPAAAAVAAVAAWNLRPDERPPELLLQQAQEWLDAGQADDALRLAQQVLQRDPTSSAALFVAGEAASREKDFAAAAGYFDRVAAGDLQFARALCSAGDAWLNAGNVGEAESRYLRALDAPAGAQLAQPRIADLYGRLSRTWEQRPYLMSLLRTGQAAAPQLSRLAYAEAFAGSLEDLERWHAVTPQDAKVLCGLAAWRQRRGQLVEALTLLREVVKIDPQNWEGQALLGQVLLDRSDSAGWLAWHGSTPARLTGHPRFWTVRGMWLEERKQSPGALRCYLEALRLDPNATAACLRAAQLLASLGRQSAAELLQDRARGLLALQLAVEALHKSAERKADALETICSELQRLGRLREALAWRELQLVEGKPSAAARAALTALRGKQPLDPPPLVSEGVDPHAPAAINLAEFPLPDWSDLALSHSTPPTAQGGSVRFVDSAQGAGIDFTFVADHDPAGGVYLRETVGGGVAALDYDGDSWPDLYFTQAGDRPPASGPQPLLDQLYRNLSGKRFQATTAQAHLHEDRFSGGVAAGDLDSDGWPDLYIANIGGNSLYRNNGDGTFDEVSREAGLDQPSWTASCLIADLNGDALPDLFDVTYAGGDAQEKTCRPYACAPKSFAALADRLWLASGDGLYQECSEAAGIDAPDGVGLGLLAADFDGSGRLSLFVANDQTPNFFFLNQTATPSGPPRFTERGVLCGLAVDGWGRSQACMGVAAGDADGDGALDLFVTNFENEPNTLYLNRGQGEIFIDATAASGLSEPSIPMLGFGTQFIDGDLDGWPDLIVANGHVHDRRGEGGSFHMRPQFFQNVGQGQFVELPAQTLGTFFEGEYLGRGLARLDWNRDGREDAAISQIEQPAALLTNTSPAAGHFLAIQFRGVQSVRDAIGVAVTVTAGGRTRIAQLTAGDGYMASNQRQLVFGLAEADQVQELVVRWPSGNKQTFHDVAADAEYLLIEGAQELAPLGNQEW